MSPFLNNSARASSYDEHDVLFMGFPSSFCNYASLRGAVHRCLEIFDWKFDSIARARARRNSIRTAMRGNKISRAVYGNNKLLPPEL